VEEESDRGRMSVTASNSSTGSSASDERQRLLPPLPPRNRSTSLSKRPRVPVAAPIVLEEMEEEKEDGNLVVYFLLMLVFALGNRVFGRLQTYPLHNYPIFLSMILCLVYVPVCFAYIIPAIMFTTNITDEQRQIPKYKFAVMGAYDSLAGLLSTFAVNYIASASTVVLVQQSAIPISMMVSFLTLGSRYTQSQYLGASIVMGGIVLVLIPSFMGGGQQTDASGNAVDPAGQLLWIGVLVISCVPMCLSSVYKEKALGEVEIDCTYLNGWVAVFQLLIAVPLCFPSASVQDMPISNILPNIYQGFLCWGGVNTVTLSNNPYNQPLDNCADGPLLVTTFLFFNVIYNFLIVVILKYGSANILWLASTMIGRW
jgi:drug/metabolite transporter (DMT)-like permease